MLRLSFVFPVLAVLAVGACATVADERLSTIVVDGREYTLRTRTIDGPTGTYETTSARVRGKHFICIIDSPGDCEAAVRQGRESSLFDSN
ncbi:hypothetical protein [Roseobacter sinensis]|uniref:Lipoprotein n=1 Tax=Roseobacter sinensis TaxID=2931391 RepID=A0ABT3BAF1_9RHOB|nr:hypothetical protein [Roseobacter sp. WL0113]MCV3270552.1 hypothetical protein [Roseobacter sp. WL0113]